MAFCKACGQDIGTANFCPKCGANQSASVAAQQITASVEGMAENVAGLLCYAAWWITGIIFLLIDKRPFVRFHAAQSIAVFGGLTIIRVALGMMHFFLFSFGLGILVGLIGLALWIVLMIKAFQHEMFRVPIAADIADSLAK